MTHAVAAALVLAVLAQPTPFRISSATSPDAMARVGPFVADYAGGVQVGRDSIRVRIDRGTIAFHERGLGIGGVRVVRFIVGLGRPTSPGALLPGAVGQQVAIVLPSGREAGVGPMRFAIARPDMRREAEPVWLVIAFAAVDLDQADRTDRTMYSYVYAPEPLLAPVRSRLTDSVAVLQAVDRFRTAFDRRDAVAVERELADTVTAVYPGWALGDRTPRAAVTRTLRTYFDSVERRLATTGVVAGGALMPNPPATGGQQFPIELRGDVAHATWAMSRANQAPFDTRMERVTLVLEYTHAGWRVVTMHVSDVKAPFAPPP